MLRQVMNYRCWNEYPAALNDIMLQAYRKSPVVFWKRRRRQTAKDGEGTGASAKAAVVSVERKKREGGLEPIG